jgi:tetratricopeptide (TPR) repeat protein
MSRAALKIGCTFLLAACCAWTAIAQAPQKQPDSSGQDQPPSGGYSSSKKTDAGDPASGATAGVAANPDAPVYDPFHAQQDVDVGAYYMHKGDVDAAIGRFEDAIKLKANFGKPRLLLAEAYLKKGNKSEALKYYKEYLQVYPGAPDAAKVREKIGKLSK